MIAAENQNEGNPRTMQSYEARIIRVLDYIHDTPDGDLSLDALAEVAAMSRFHWHRVFHAMTGETCAQAVRRIRLNRAACWLVQRDWSVAEVARRVGYPNRQSFSRVFAELYGLSPAQFRKAGRLPPSLTILNPPKGVHTMFTVEIVERPSIRLAAIAHRGAYLEVGKAFEALGATLGARGLWPKMRGMAGVYYDDPRAVAEADLRSHAGAIMGEGMALEAPLEEVQLQGGRHAVLHFKGPYAGLKAAYDYLYGPWLAETGEEPRDAPSFELYLNAPMDTAPENLLTDICLPLA